MNARPTHAQWFWLNLRIGLLSFVPASRAALYREKIVDKYRWVTPDEFNEAMTLAQLLPGPNLVNLSVYLGWQLMGTGAVLSGLMALALPGSLIAVVAYRLLPTDNRNLVEIFQGFALAGVALMAVFLGHLDTGVRREELKQDPRRGWLRVAILVGATAAMVLGAPLLPVIAVSVPLSIAGEFLP